MLCHVVARALCDVFPDVLWRLPPSLELSVLTLLWYALARALVL